MAMITLTTDFGLSDGFVGTMKGVILGIAPGANIVDISHEIPPQDIQSGAFVLKAAYPYFPPGTIHLAVVDPGVGSERRVLAVQTERAILVGPDNGVLSWALEGEKIEAMIHANRPEYWLEHISHTFHGRDIFSPVAAHLARGVPVQKLGLPVDDPRRLPLPQIQRTVEGNIQSEIIYIDRFGNLITSIRLDPKSYQILNLPDQNRDVFLGPQSRIEILGQTIGGIKNSYSEASPGELLAVADSSGHLELAVRDGNAAFTLGVSLGVPVQVIPAPVEPG